MFLICLYTKVRVVLGLRFAKWIRTLVWVTDDDDDDDDDMLEIKRRLPGMQVLYYTNKVM
jgi:hypothetical protein